jgi:hypothetical protein
VSITANEIFDSRSGSWTTDSGRTYVRQFRVLSTNPINGPAVAIAACGINRGDQYITLGSDGGLEQDLNAYAYSLGAVQEEGDSLGWIVTIEYGPYSALFAGGGPTQNPLLQPIDVSWQTRSQQTVVDQDINGLPIVNTAGDPFDPPLMEDQPRATLTVVRNEATFNQSLQIQYYNAVNSDVFANYNPLMARVLNIGSKSMFHQDAGWYYQVTYEFEFLDPISPTVGLNGYRRTVLSQGMRAISSSVSGEKYHVMFKGVPVTEPVLLTQKGNLAKTAQDPYWLIFQTRPELPFAAFQFDPLALTGQRTGFKSGYGPPFYTPPG